MHRHCWTVVERIGSVTVQRCARCPKTRVRLRAAVRVSPDIPSSRHPDKLPNPPAATTGPGGNVPGALNQDDAWVVDHESPDYHG